MLEPTVLDADEENCRPTLVGGFFAPSWLCFNFYLLCRRQTEGPGSKWLRLRDPTFLAWNGLGAAMVIPWAALLLLVDHYLPFLHRFGIVWIALHLPSQPGHAWSYAWMVCTIVSGMVLFTILFRQNKRIMQFFSAYDRSPHTLAPSAVFLPIWYTMMGLAAYGMWYRDYGATLLIMNLFVWGIFIATEIGFRIWWRGWCHNHADTPY